MTWIFTSQHTASLAPTDEFWIGISTHHLQEFPPLSPKASWAGSTHLVSFPRVLVSLGIDQWAWMSMLPFHPQTLTPITGKGSTVRINMDQEDDFLQWKWLSELNGERLLSTGMERFPSSKKKTRNLSEGSEQMEWQGPVQGWAFNSYNPLSWAPLKNTTGSFSFFSWLSFAIMMSAVENDFIPGSE